MCTFSNTLNGTSKYHVPFKGTSNARRADSLDPRLIVPRVLLENTMQTLLLALVL